MLEEPQEPGLNLGEDIPRDAPPRTGAGRSLDPVRPTHVDAETEVHFLDYVKVLYKRRWLAISVFVLVVVVTAAYTFTTVPIYEAKAELMIEVDTPNYVSFKEVVDEQEAKADYYQTQYTILKSRSLARKTLESLKLWDTPPFGGVSKTRPSVFSVGGAEAALKNVFETKTADIKDPPSVIETMAQSRAIDAFLGRLSVSPVRNSRLVDITYDLPDPVLATTITNALAQNYIDQDLEYKFLASKGATDWLSQRLIEQRKQVEAAELALQRYREQNDAISVTDSQNIVVQKLTQLNAAVTAAKTDRLQKEAMYSQLAQLKTDPAALDTFPAIESNTFIQAQKTTLADLIRQKAQLAEHYGPLNEEITKIDSQIQSAQSRLNVEIQKVVQSVTAEYQAAVSQEKSLQTALDEQKAEALHMNSKSIQYGVLQRDLDSSKQIYDSLMQSSKEKGVSGELKTSNIRIIDAAERQPRPVYPNKPLNMLSALFGGGLLAVGLVFFFEYLDNRIKTPDEIKHHLGLPHLGLLPLLSKSEETGGYALLTGSAPVNFVEAFRVLRTNVLFSSAETGGQSVLVTSTGPGEGKSLTAANLAISLAQAGRRVLLIDADMRKPKVHSLFDMSQEPGLSNLLVGDSKASEAVKKSTITGLWLLTSGRVPPNPAELLGSQRFMDFLRSLRQHFDWVVIDSPPVMAVADASVIAHATSGVLFVVGAEMTSRHAARRAVEQLEGAQARFFGAVLNRVDLQRNAYYYSQYYRRSYSDYYQKSPT